MRTATDSSVTPKQAGDLLGVSTKTIRAWADDGKLASWRTPGNQRRFLLADVLALRIQQQNGGVEEQAS